MEEIKKTDAKKHNKLAISGELIVDNNAISGASSKVNKVETINKLKIKTYNLLAQKEIISTEINNYINEKLKENIHFLKLQIIQKELKVISLELIELDKE